MTRQKKERIDKILSHMGMGSRADIKRNMKQSEITVNGSVIRDSGFKIDPYQDEIYMNGNRIRYQKYIYIMLNKPTGVVSATEDHKQKTVIDLISTELQVFKPFPVGRLDKDTVGLLLLTNDGELSHQLLSPKKHVTKTYIAMIEHPIKKEDVEAFAEGVALEDGYTCLPAVLKNSQEPFAAEEYGVEISIREGKYHQIKRMFAAIGNRVIQLKRIQMGPVILDDALKPGDYRELTTDEVDAMKNL